MAETYTQAAARLSQRMDERRMERRKHIIKVARNWHKNFCDTHPEVFLFPLTAGGRKYLREYLSGEMDEYTKECFEAFYKMDFDRFYRDDELVREARSDCDCVEYRPEFPEDYQIINQIEDEEYPEEEEYEQ